MGARSVAAANGQQNGSQEAGFTGVADAPEWVQELAHLSLYFLLWTEAANLRHTPELLWLLYHVMLSSNNFNKVRLCSGRWHRKCLSLEHSCTQFLIRLQGVSNTADGCTSQQSGRMLIAAAVGTTACSKMCQPLACHQ